MEMNIRFLKLFLCFHFVLCVFAGFETLYGARELNTDASAERNNASFEPRNTFDLGEVVIIERTDAPKWRYGIIKEKIQDASKWKVLVGEIPGYIQTRELRPEQIGKLSAPTSPAATPAPQASGKKPTPDTTSSLPASIDVKIDSHVGEKISNEMKAYLKPCSPEIIPALADNDVVAIKLSNGIFHYGQITKLYPVATSGSWKAFEHDALKDPNSNQGDIDLGIDSVNTDPGSKVLAGGVHGTILEGTVIIIDQEKTIKIFKPEAIYRAPSPESISKKAFTTLTDWAKACSLQQENYIKISENSLEYPTPIVGWPEFFEKIETFVAKCKSSGFFDQKNWLAQQPDQKMFAEFPRNIASNPSILFVQKFGLSRHPAKVCFIGDIHGSIHSLLRNLLRLQKLGYLDDNFKIKDPDFYLIFNGDFVDRGRYGAEVWYTILFLKLINWDRVFLLRGNHETKKISSGYGFKNEIAKKYGVVEDNAFNILLSLYELLPFALYLGFGKDEQNRQVCFQCCHGCIEIGYKPKDFLKSTVDYELLTIEKLNETAAEMKSKHPALIGNVNTYEEKSVDIGFNWSDVIQEDDGKIWSNWERVEGVKGDEGPGYQSDVKATDLYLKTINKNERIIVGGFIRGHQDRSFGFKLLYGDVNLTKDEVPEAAKENTSYAQGPWHWIHVKEKYDQINPFGFRIYNQNYNDHAPIFTSTTATEGQSVPYDFLLMLFTNEKYENWRLKPYEFKLPPDRDFKKEMKEADTFEAWQAFIDQNFKDMKAAEDKFLTTLSDRIKELQSFYNKPDHKNYKLLVNARAEPVLILALTKKTNQPAAGGEEPSTPKKSDITALTTALTTLKQKLIQLSTALSGAKA